MSAEVKLVNNTAKGVVTIPMSVIEFDDSNTPYVLKEDQKGNPLRTEIETGINNGTIVEVKKGISNGETILYINPDNQTNMGFRGPGSANNRTDGGSD
jgi:HlyD family secretion protein